MQYLVAANIDDLAELGVLANGFKKLDRKVTKGAKIAKKVG